MLSRHLCDLKCCRIAFSKQPVIFSVSFILLMQQQFLYCCEINCLHQLQSESSGQEETVFGRKEDQSFTFEITLNYCKRKTSQHSSKFCERINQVTKCHSVFPSLFIAQSFRIFYLSYSAQMSSFDPLSYAQFNKLLFNTFI